jgi:hypothetical protein
MCDSNTLTRVVLLVLRYVSSYNDDNAPNAYPLSIPYYYLMYCTVADPTDPKS